MLFHILAPRDSCSAFSLVEPLFRIIFWWLKLSCFSSFYQQTKVLAAYMEKWPRSSSKSAVDGHNHKHAHDRPQDDSNVQFTLLQNNQTRIYSPYLLSTGCASLSI